MLGLFYFFGKSGLYVYMGVALIAANLQVLKGAQFSFFPYPIALGTEIFSSLFLASNILNEHFGQKAAQKGIWLSFCASLLMTLLMFLTIGIKPLSLSPGENYYSLADNHYHLKALFTPTLALLSASLLSYLMSQYTDVWLFRFFRQKTAGKLLWLRTILANLTSALIDNSIFSIFAWIIFASPPLSFKTVLFSYILGTYGLRVILTTLNTPFIYLSSLIMRKKSHVS